MQQRASGEHADQLVNHWYWRPRFRPGREFYTWHLTFDEEIDLHRLVVRYQDALRDVSGLNMVAIQRPHVTMQGIGFVAEVDQSEVQDIVVAVQRRLALLSRRR